MLVLLVHASQACGSTAPC